MLTQTVEPHIEARFFARFAHSRRPDFLAAIDVAAGKHPFAVAGLDGAADEHHPVLLVA